MVVSIFSLVVWSASSFGNDWAEGTVQGYYMARGWNTFEAGWLIGHRVYSPVGGDLGYISDLMIDRDDGHVALVVVDRVPGRGDAMVAVPFGELSMSGNAFAFNFTDDRLAAAPTYNEFADANNPKRAEDIYRYFGLQPYWSEGGDM